MPDEAISFSPVPEPEPAFSEAEQKRMLQHISLRITEKIKSAYPDATLRCNSGRKNLPDTGR